MKGILRPALLFAGIAVLVFRSPPPMHATAPPRRIERFDLNGDGLVTPADVLLLVHFINEQDEVTESELDFRRSWNYHPELSTSNREFGGWIPHSGPASEN